MMMGMVRTQDMKYDLLQLTLYLNMIFSVSITQKQIKTYAFRIELLMVTYQSHLIFIQFRKLVTD